MTVQLGAFPAKITDAKPWGKEKGLWASGALGPQLLAIFRSPRGSSARLLVCSITSPSNCQGTLASKRSRSQGSHPSSGLWLPSHIQLILLWHSDLWSFSERIIVKMGAEGRTGAVNHLGEGKIIHIPHSADTHTHTHILQETHSGFF